MFFSRFSLSLACLPRHHQRLQKVRWVLYKLQILRAAAASSGASSGH
jgi:hypothetical protein